MFVSTFLCLVILLHLFRANNSTLLAALSDVENYLNVETKSVELLKHSKCSKNEIRRSITLYEKTIINGKLKGIKNPIFIYSLLKNASSLWGAIDRGLLKYCKEDALVLDAIKILRQQSTSEAPSKEDVHRSRLALARLQEVYNLNQTSMIYGQIIPGIDKLERLMNARDCFEMGLVFMDKTDYVKSASWFNMALDQLQFEREKPSIVKNRISEMFPVVQIKEAEKARTNVIESIVNESDRKLILKYHSLCRGDFYKVQNSSYSWLICYYKTNRPFLRIAPIKVEILNMDPPIYKFHNVMSKNEMKIIQRIAKPKLKRAQTLGNIESDHRIAKMAYIKSNEHVVLKTVDARTEMMTDLDLNYAEKLQDPQYDERIATVLFYMESPEAGGATAFPTVDLSVFPEQGDAIFWYNLLKNGQIDDRVLHAGCPVLYGKKWVINKWIYHRGQEFRRPCSLNKIN